MDAVDKTHKETGTECARGNGKFLRTRNKRNDDGNEQNDAITTRTSTETNGDADRDAASHATANTAIHGRNTKNDGSHA